ncbi:hypothetical protein TCAL_06513 [Tigriopus californicus]|uniref:CD109 antigen n=1 Tax=Tigriopus californicus TaxID=6832 RepID=A0A553P4G7_TIGCA|nr:hypothetical protein TCAL_06513 [Tigriopus californicus]
MRYPLTKSEVFQAYFLLNGLCCVIVQSQNGVEVIEEYEMRTSPPSPDASMAALAPAPPATGTSEILENDEVRVTFFAKSGLDEDLDTLNPVAAQDLDYMIVASKVLRPNTVFRIIVILYEDCAPLEISASISRDGVALTTNEIRMHPTESNNILLMVPPDNSNTTAKYQLRIYGSYQKKDGGTVFEHQSELEFSKKFLAITISSSRAVYCAEQVIRMRIVMLTTSLKPYTGIVDLYIVDPDGYTIRKWNSKELNVGVLTEDFQLPLFPKVGFWTIRVQAEGQVEELKVKVEKHYLPKFEIVVTMPAFILDSEELINAYVDGSFVVERLAKGNVKLDWYVKKIDNWNPMHNDSVLYREQYRYQTKISNLYHAGLYKPLVNDPNSNASQQRPFDDPYANASFGPNVPLRNEWTYLRTDFQYYRPQVEFQPFTIYLQEIEDFMGHRAGIQIMFDDLMPLTTDELKASTLDVRPYALTRSGEAIEIDPIKIPMEDDNDPNQTPQDINEYDEFLEEFDDIEETFQSFALKSLFQEFRETGVHQFSFQIPEDAIQIKVIAEYSHPDYGNEVAEITAYPAYSTNNHFVKVITSTKSLKEGEYVVFHAKTNFAFNYLDWMIISKGLILESGREIGENIHPEISTFSAVVSSDMSPGFHVIVYVATKDNEVVTDSAFIPVEAIKSHEIEFYANQVKDHTMKTVELTCRGDPGAVFMIATMRVGQFPAQGIFGLSKAYLLENLHKFEEGSKHVHKVLRTDRSGETPDQVLFYPAMAYETDGQRSFEERNLLVFSSHKRLSVPDFVKTCNATKGERACLAKGCFTLSQRCNGINDCDDGFDESNCIDETSAIQTQHRNFRMSRQSRFEDFYDIADGDWGWIITNIDEDGEQFLTLDIPETPDDFYFNIFSLSKENGLGLYAEPPVFNTIRPLDFYCEAPEAVHRGESIGIRCMFINRGPHPLEATIMLPGSEDYAFIHVEHFGFVSSYAPRQSYGDYHHYVAIQGYSELEVPFPIAPKIEQGVITVAMQLSSQINNVVQEVEIEILGEGSIVHRHTSLLLDLKNRANVLRFMNIIVDETPIIPYEIYRRYVSGSPNAHILICGDVIGPIFPDDQPVSLETMFPTGNGRFGKGTDYHAFNLGANTWQLHYLRLTNQLVGVNRELAKTVFQQMNVEYTAVMRRFSSHGWLSNFDNSGPSVWLTAWTVSIFTHVSFQDWEDFIYIDPVIITSAVLWVLNYQSAEGAFFETQEYQDAPLHKVMTPIVNQNVSIHAPLTALVLIMLEDTSSIVQGNGKQYSASARQRATLYLERNLPLITDGYAIAIVTYALALSKSAMADVAFGHMMQAARQEDSMIYWGRTPIRTNRVRYEFNRPFLEAKDYQDNDALAVEATGYALLSIFMMEGGGITFTQEKIVQWLNTMRLGDGGFISTVDTIVALQALVLYSYHSRIKDITDLQVDVDLPDSNVTESFYFTGQNLAKGQRIDIENVWGHMNIFAHGAGQAVAQLDVNYGVDYEPFKDSPATDCFKLTIQEFFHGRNKSEITVKSCFSWTLTIEGPVSGLTMLVIDTPSGYVMEQPLANGIVESGVVPEMKDSDVTKVGKTIWYFNQVPNETRCFEHTVRRYHPVANLTRTRQAILVEPYRPERFVIKTFNATSLYILSICEVCGSFQCPYCPTFSGSGIAAFSFFCLFVTTLLTIVQTFP